MASVFTNGCFDLLHAGHLQLLSYCRYLAGADSVIVAIDADTRIRASKGTHRPYYDQAERRDLIMMLTSNGKLDSKGFGSFLVDWVEVFSNDQELYDLVKKHEPDYIVKGADWKGQKIIGSDLATLHFAPTYFKSLCSTTDIEKRIINRCISSKGKKT